MNNFRSNCPISSALELIGDKWSLLIVRDMLIFQKSTFKDFESSPEHIATNILSSRLKLLECSGILTKHKLKTNKKTNVYLLTAKGYDLADILAGFLTWGDKHLRLQHPEMTDINIEMNNIELNKKIELIITAYKEFRDLQFDACVK